MGSRLTRVSRIAVAVVFAFLILAPQGSGLALALAPAAPLPSLTQPVNDFAHVIDPASAAEMDRQIRALKDATGDVVIVATVPTIEPYGDIREYANKLFENNGRGIGQKGKDNGILILLALKERRVWIEVGYDLEQWITDGYSGETAREVMTPEFRQGRYGAGLLAGTTRIIGRIAQGRNVQITGVQAPQDRPQQGIGLSFWWIILIFILIILISRIGGGPGRPMQRWGRGGWSGWSSGVGPFGGGWGGGGFGGSGGFGGGFGGFGGGRSGGGGGGAGW
jgi:uncharacterized protein